MGLPGQEGAGQDYAPSCAFRACAPCRFSASPSLLSSRCRVLGPRLRLSSNDSLFCVSCAVPMPTGAVAPPFSLSPCEGGRTFAGRFRRGASGGDGFVVRKKDPRKRRRPGWPGRKDFLSKLKMMERSRPRVEAGPACHPYARIFFAAAVTSGTTLKRSSTIP